MQVLQASYFGTASSPGVRYADEFISSLPSPSDPKIPVSMVAMAATVVRFYLSYCTASSRTVNTGSVRAVILGVGQVYSIPVPRQLRCSSLPRPYSISRPPPETSGAGQVPPTRGKYLEVGKVHNMFTCMEYDISAHWLLGRMLMRRLPTPLKMPTRWILRTCRSNLTGDLLVMYHYCS